MFLLLQVQLLAMKLCPRCKQLLPDSAYNKREGGLASYCIECNREYQRADNQRRREERAARRREIRKFFFV